MLQRVSKKWNLSGVLTYDEGKLDPSSTSLNIWLFIQNGTASKNIFLKNVQTNHFDISNIFFLAETIGQIWYKFADSFHQHESAFLSKQRILP